MLRIIKHKEKSMKETEEFKHVGVTPTVIRLKSEMENLVVKKEISPKVRKIPNQRGYCMKYQEIYIEDVSPSVDGGDRKARVQGEDTWEIRAKIYSASHQVLRSIVTIRDKSGKKIMEVGMDSAEVDDFYKTYVSIKNPGIYSFTISSWIDRIETLIHGVVSWMEAGESVTSDLMEIYQIFEHMEKKSNRKSRNSFSETKNILMENPPVKEKIGEIPEKYRKILDLYEEKLAFYKSSTYYFEVFDTILSKSWYEIFPRSQPTDTNKSGTFKDMEKKLDYISNMGFEIIYLPPIHPIGLTSRRGKNGKLPSQKGDVGSPWAIGNSLGGHKSINPDLGTMEDFKELIKKTREMKMDIALDIAFQCSPDHPYVTEHPKWFSHRSDGSIRYSENPPKKYYDIFPLNFYTDEREELWVELRSIFTYWIENGIKIFRVDNPHTKPIGFWEWVIGTIREDHPEVVFLSESFTTGNLMYRLSKVGFQLSYSYFTWKNYDWEIKEYFTELSKPEINSFFTPVLFTNTPDILPYALQNGGRGEYIVRAILAATLSSSWGIYSGFEICESTAIPGKEEYLDSEKYEIKRRDLESNQNIREEISKLNQLRSKNLALRERGNLKFLVTTNPSIIAYTRGYGRDMVLIILNINPFEVQDAMVDLPDEWKGTIRINLMDIYNQENYIWIDGKNFVRLTPEFKPVHILKRVFK
jgi:1,4-alpha-glucan branching enzyme/starch synthase (maltosyl-transferring)